MWVAKDKIAKLDYLLTGTIIKKFGPCGKKGCRCGKGRKNWHGPYYIWTRKEDGKTITRSLSPAQAQFCKKAIVNYRKLNVYLHKWKAESLNIIDKVGSAS